MYFNTQVKQLIISFKCGVLSLSYICKFVFLTNRIVTDELPNSFRELLQRQASDNIVKQVVFTIS